jgi:hypothetical protein
MTFSILPHSLTTIGAIFAPLVTTELIIPALMHPYSYFGSIPFEPPGMFKYMFLYLLSIVVMIEILATISNIMATEKECNKANIMSSILNSRWSGIFAIIGVCFIFLMPFVKVPLLVLLFPVPFSNQIVNGLILSLFVMFGTYISHNYSIRDTCLVN